VSFLYLPLGDCLGVPLLALLFTASLLAGGPVARGGGGGRGGFSFRSGGGGEGGAEPCCPHLGGVGEDATSRTKASGIQLTGGGGAWGSEARAACARAGEGEGVQINRSFVCGSLLAYVHQRRDSHRTALRSLGCPFSSINIRLEHKHFSEKESRVPTNNDMDFVLIIRNLT
jgi:hypothetical protein